MNENDKIKEILTRLISLPGISGHETSIAGAIHEIWEPLSDEVKISKIGNVYAKKSGSGSAENIPHKKILIATHMDGIGMIVSQIKGEFLSFAQIGGFDPRILPGQFVTVHTRDDDLPGLIAQPGANLTQKDYRNKPVPMAELLIDCGLDAETLQQKVQVGDVISYANLPIEMPTNCIAGHSLDNRASVAALTACLSELQHIRHQWDVYAAATTQEETVFLGGKTSAFDIRPDIAIAVDVTFAKGPGSTDWRTKELESGPSLGYGMNIHPAIFTFCKEICETRNIPYTMDMLPGMSGTDGDPIQVSACGFPTMVISIPLRYMHTPVEVISMKDIMNTGHLLAEVITGLDDEFLKKLSWEDIDEQ